MSHSRLDTEDVRDQAVFGGADGLTTVLGLIAGLEGHPNVLWRAALSAGLAGFVGMAGGAWLSGSDTRAAVSNGAGAFLACLVPALPFTAFSGALAVFPSLVLVGTIATVIAWLRPEHGWEAILQTFGILLAAAVLCYLASFL